MARYLLADPGNKASDDVHKKAKGATTFVPSQLCIAMRLVATYVMLPFAKAQFVAHRSTATRIDRKNTTLQCRIIKYTGGCTCCVCLAHHECCNTKMLEYASLASSNAGNMNALRA